MKKSSRVTSQLDYNELHKTGEKVLKTQPDRSIDTVASLLENLSFDEEKSQKLESMATNITRLSVKEAVLTDDINDFLEENSIKDYGGTIEDIDIVINKIENLRTQFRMTHKELQIELREKYEENLSKSFISTLDTIKSYISDAKQQRRRLKEKALSKEKDDYYYRDSFKFSSLNIKIPKFKGYDSSMDIYTFQTQFEKLHLKSTPPAVLPDLLKSNYLESPALLLVKNVESIEEIWKRLKDAYGSQKLLLTKKLSDIKNMDSTSKIKDTEKVMETLCKIINAMKDLMTLADKHDIQDKLYHSDALDSIYKLLGDDRMMRYLSINCDDPVEGPRQWNQLIRFIEKEIKMLQQKLLINGKPSPTVTNKYQPRHQQPSSHHADQETSKDRNEKVSPFCFICGSSDHVQTNGPGGTKLVQYFACQKFVDMTPSQRFAELNSKGFCSQCLFPGADRNKGKHKEGHCQRLFVCQHPSHKDYQSKKHVLVCNEHKDTQQNRDLLEHYKARCIVRCHQLQGFSKNIKLSSHVNSTSLYTKNPSIAEDDNDHRAIYMLQTIHVNGQPFTLFYDSGCSDFISKHQAVQRIGSKAKLIKHGPIKLGGVGGITSSSQHGIYSVQLPLKNGSTALFTGICIDQVTSTFPTYPLHGAVENDIHDAFTQNGGDPAFLPKLPTEIGGDVDFMVGIKYNRYFPEQIFQLPSGLTIYRSCFMNSDGKSDGIIGGPHRIFDEIELYHQHKQSSTNSTSNFIKMQYRLYEHGYHVNPDLSLLGFKNENQFDTDSNHSVFTTPPASKFDEVELAGSEINFRCVKCRSCTTCKKHNIEDSVSIKEEIEQDVIENSVTVDLQNGITTAKLPLMSDPTVKLSPNRHVALKIYYQQIHRLSKNPEDKQEILASEAKLQSLAYVEYTKNLPKEIQAALSSSPIQNYIPWRAVWKDSSVSTPCRIVFDASMSTESGYSLNDLLAKGRNNMNKLVEIFLRWRTHSIGFHTDVQKMYNSVKLDPSHWCFQRYLWQDHLDSNHPPEEKIIMTLIYGVKSSGNQAEFGLRDTAKQLSTHHPEVNRIIQEDVYVDDCLSGSSTTESSMKLADETEYVVNHGGFTLKGVSMSGKEPDPSLTADGQSVSVAGLKWYPKLDQLTLDVKEINFAKKHRGKRREQIKEPTKLTRRMCTSKVGEIFDISGMITPITATMKVDLHTLVQRKLDWDDKIPDNLRQTWTSHFQLMEEIKDVRFQRAVVPSDAQSPLQVTTLEFGDASKSLACATTYIRFLRQDGSHSCQLIFSRSRLVPDDMSQPRAELFAALLNTHTAETVRRAVRSIHKKSFKFTDSQIVLHWITNPNIQLKQWVRNRIIEIHRFTTISSWSYIPTDAMIADLGTRRCTNLDVIKQGSIWTDGYEWMRQDESHFPIQNIALNQEDVKFIQKESHASTNESFHSSQDTYWQNVQKRYKFSNYLIDPNRHRFRTIIRIIALVFIFIDNTRKRSQLRRTPIIQGSRKRFTILSTHDIQNAENYIFSKATNEVKSFIKPTLYKNISKEVNGILHYTGRILPTDEVTIVGKATNAMIDLSATKFAVPIVDKSSPIAFSIVNEVHWHHPTAAHSGVETTWRYVLEKIYIIEGRSLVKMVRQKCEKCRFIAKKTLEVSMGPISPHNVTIAPAFFISQVDLAGPFKSISPYNKRTTIKIWIIVFCCTTTSATKLKIMEDYSTIAFINAFTRFSCEVGYPKRLLTDEGSQLTKGCDSTRFDFQDIQGQLHSNVSTEFETCPVGGHNVHGKVERRIREVRRSLEKMLSNERLSLMQWETMMSRIANSINNQPLAIGNLKADLDTLDLITPNRLLLGRNNNRSPTGNLVTADYNKIIDRNQEIFNSWFENWLLVHVPKLMHQPKWFSSDNNLSIGDVVLFLKQENQLCSTYQYGMVQNVEYGRDGRIRTARVRYRNHNENVNRETRRAVRNLVVIHHVHEISLMEEMSNALKL